MSAPLSIVIVMAIMLGYEVACIAFLAACWKIVCRMHRRRPYRARR